VNPPDFEEVDKFIGVQLIDFYRQRVQILGELKLDDLLEVNPYLFLPKNTMNVGKLVIGLLENFLAVSEEKLFDNFLVNLAFFVVEMMGNGRKSSLSGIDLEFERNGGYYLVVIKPNPDWGDSFEQDELEHNFQQAVIQTKQLQANMPVQPVLGICYGNVATTRLPYGLKVEGQNFWYLITQDKQFYSDIVERISCHLRAHNEFFNQQKSATINRFTLEFINRFCDERYAIDWVKLVEFNSGNFDLEQFFS
jgi:hypothetical protein